jgi:HK97 family phage major capsid protein
MAAATRVDASGVVKKIKAVIENDEPNQPAIQPVKKSRHVNAEDYPKHLSKSDGFLLTRMIAAQQNFDGVDASNEIEGCKLFKKALAETGMLPAVMENRSFMVPISMDLLPEATMNHEDARVMKSMWDAGAANQDPEETAWLARRIRKSQSAYIDNIGGTLVAPPVQGELIELMRPKQALINAGCTTVPLPPQGKISYPRQTSPSTMYWIGENTSITESAVGTGQISLQAKKGGVFLTVPNELLKYASVAADALIRKDAAQTLALGFDNAALYGIGGANVPRGLDKYTGTNQLIAYEGLTPAPKGIGNNGNTLRPEDAYRMIGLIEARNFDFKGWVTTPGLANNINGYRADAATPGDAAGQFVTAITRAITDKMPGTNFGGYPVSKSNVVTSSQTKGSGTGLTQIWGGAWEHLLLGMYGAVEFATSNQAGSTFQNDQTAVRALIHCDSVPRYEGAFCLYQYLINSTN